MLTTERLTLRLPTPEDAEALDAINHANWQRVGFRQRSLDEVRAMIVDTPAFGAPGWQQYVVEPRAGGAIMGRVAINFDGPGERQAEIGYGFLPEFRGSGYAAEAIGRTLTELFDTYRLHRVIAITGIDNEPSRRLLGRLGFRLEAETIESFFHHFEQRFVDETIYAILAREWAAR